MLDDAPQLGRPVEVVRDQIDTLLENNQHSTLCEIDDILKISKSIKLLVKIKKCDFHFTLKTQLTFWPTQYNQDYSTQQSYHLELKDI